MWLPVLLWLLLSEKPMAQQSPEAKFLLQTELELQSFHTRFQSLSRTLGATQGGRQSRYLMELIEHWQHDMTLMIQVWSLVQITQESTQSEQVNLRLRRIFALQIDYLNHTKVQVRQVLHNAKEPKVKQTAQELVNFLDLLNEGLNLMYNRL